MQALSLQQVEAASSGEGTKEGGGSQPVLLAEVKSSSGSKECRSPLTDQGLSLEPVNSLLSSALTPEQCEERVKNLIWEPVPIISPEKTGRESRAGAVGRRLRVGDVAKIGRVLVKVLEIKLGDPGSAGEGSGDNLLTED